MDERAFLTRYPELFHLAAEDSWPHFQKLDALLSTRRILDRLDLPVEQRARIDWEAVERHRDLALAYERGWVWAPPHVGGASSARRENKSLVTHCENLARIYQQAAEENFALAREHRQIAAETKD